MFEHRYKWRKSVIIGKRIADFISTDVVEGVVLIRRHQEGTSGKPQPAAAAKLMRTVLSSVNAGEAATAALAKREMQSWQLLQLEPTALRRPDPVDATAHLGPDGSHLPATLYRLGRAHPASLYAAIGNRLAELNEDVRHVRVERDEKRDLLTVEVTDRSGTRHPARALSDGTLRFLALTVIEQDEQMGGVLCLEEPENGIHPARIVAMLDLLRDIVTDPFVPVEPTSRLRQVIINTHSPAVVNQLPADTLVVAEREATVGANGQLIHRVRFSALPGTWRTTGEGAAPPVALGKLLAYLNPEGNAPAETAEEGATPPARRERRLRDVYEGQLDLFDQAVRDL